MKRFVMALAAGALFAGLEAGTGCTSSGRTSSTSSASYTCSMCGGNYSAPGKCPKCGMELTKR